MNDTYLHMTAGALIACLTSLFFYRCTSIRIGFCLASGLILGSTVGVLKEEVYDRQMGKGVPSKIDKMNTGYGSMVGCVISIPIIQINEQRIERDLLKFENLNIKTDTNGLSRPNN